MPAGLPYKTTGHKALSVGQCRSQSRASGGCYELFKKTIPLETKPARSTNQGLYRVRHAGLGTQGMVLDPKDDPGESLAGGSS